MWLFIGYLCGAFLSPELISATPTLTAWNNIWVYAWLIFWPLGLIYYGICYMVTSFVLRCIAIGIAAIAVLAGLRYDRYYGLMWYGIYWHW